MYLSSYVLTDNQPVKNRFFFYPWQPDFGHKIQSTLALDIVRNSTGVHSLITCPPWETLPFWSEIPKICQHLFLFMEIAGWANKENAFWYVLSLEPNIVINRLTFKEERGGIPDEEVIPLEETPFNLTEINKFE